jgi:hypothetical protein
VVPEEMNPVTSDMGIANNPTDKYHVNPFGGKGQNI